MAKYMVGYCSNCGRDTKHIKIECATSAAYRVFGTVFTLGLATMLPNEYKCECTRCGKINTIYK